MIPKIIHYCWFGGNPLPESAVKCIDSWKKYCPDYAIVEWNEDNFDISSLDYTREAYQAKKWAFITDYVRLYALATVGGVYMDTDVEVLKNIDIFLEEFGFSGFERVDAVPTGIMAAEKGNLFILQLMEEYNSLHFIREDGTNDLTTNIVRITDAATKRGLKLNNKKQTVCDFTFYPKEFFCPKNSRTMEIKLTDNTYTIHHFQGSWDTDRKKIRKFIKKHVPVVILKRIVTVMDFLKVK